MEAHHGTDIIHAYDRVKQAVRSETERPHALRQAITSCRNGDVVSVIGVYGGFVDKFPMGSVMNRSRRSAAASATSSATCARCSSTSRPAGSTPRSSSPTASAWTTHRPATTPSKDKQDEWVKVVLKPSA
jgi:threonine dehydrogenase-like Zn-dependent dehydrogenase